MNTFFMFNMNHFRLEREASKYTLVSFQTFLRCTEAHHLINALEGDSLIKKLISREFDDGIGELVFIMSKNCKLEDLVKTYQISIHHKHLSIR